jgi:hypothetical protein
MPDRNKAERTARSFTDKAAPKRTSFSANASAVASSISSRDNGDLSNDYPPVASSLALYDYFNPLALWSR